MAALVFVHADTGTVSVNGLRVVVQVLKVQAAVFVNAAVPEVQLGGSPYWFQNDVFTQKFFFL